MVDINPAVRIQELTVELGGRVIVEGLSFACAAGEWVVFAGPSGCGKTTLLRTINGLQAPSRGTVLTLGSRIPGRSAQEARRVWRQTGTVLQDIALFDTRSVRGNVELGLRAAGFSRSAARAEAATWLERLGIRDKERDRPFHLSGGQRQRVALARAFAARPRLLVLDEPTSALDRTTARTVLDAIAELARGGTAVVMSSHRVDEVKELCDRMLELGGPTTASPAESAASRPARIEPVPPSW